MSPNIAKHPGAVTGDFLLLKTADLCGLIALRIFSHSNGFLKESMLSGKKNTSPVFLSFLFCIITRALTHTPFCCCSVVQAYLTLYDPMECSTPGFPVLHQFPELAQTHVHQWCHPTISSSVVPFSFCLQSFPASGSFLMIQLFASGGQSIGVSASVLLTYIQDWCPLGLISFQSKGLSRVFSNTTVQKHQFFSA